MESRRSGKDHYDGDVTGSPNPDVDELVDDDRWLCLSPSALEIDAVHAWAVLPRCGAVVVFTGTARDHTGHRTGVTHLFYEAYDEQVVPRMHELTAHARRRWPTLGRVAIQHRTGEVAVGQPAVVVAVSAPHRDEAFEAARFLIDEAKATLPIWKRERWSGGDEWVEPRATTAGAPRGRVGASHG